MVLAAVNMNICICSHFGPSLLGIPPAPPRRQGALLHRSGEGVGGPTAASQGGRAEAWTAALHRVLGSPCHQHQLLHGCSPGTPAAHGHEHGPGRHGVPPSRRPSGVANFQTGQAFGFTLLQVPELINIASGGFPSASEK